MSQCPIHSNCPTCDQIRAGKPVADTALILRRAKAWAKAKRHHTESWPRREFDIKEHAGASRKLRQAEKLLLEAIPE